ncbi:Uncharacterised protein [Listeria newyorkensis]|nr:Uncharacterised protein [Listeria newyorkensis]
MLTVWIKHGNKQIRFLSVLLERIKVTICKYNIDRIACQQLHIEIVL